MLVWTRDKEGFRANGYLIRLAAPFEWVLTEIPPATPARVYVPDAPLATARTLAAAKREAELLHAASRRRELRRRWTTTMLLAGGGAVFSAGAAPPWGFTATFALTLVAIRSLGLLTGMALAPFVSQSDDLIYQ